MSFVCWQKTLEGFERNYRAFFIEILETQRYGMVAFVI